MSASLELKFQQPYYILIDLSEQECCDLWSSFAEWGHNKLVYPADATLN